MKSNTTKKGNNIESSHNDDLNSIEEIEPIDKRFSIYLSMQTKPSKQTEQQHRLALATKKQKSKILKHKILQQAPHFCTQY